jgi:outer membrane receptor for ferric coprogen and ferric-rhodotorulic acid
MMQTRHTVPAVRSRIRLHTLMISLSLAFAGGLSMMHADTAYAQTTAAPVQYDIAAGALSDVLGRFAQQSGVAISIDVDKLRGLTSSGLKGSYALDDGFRILLNGSGYTISKTAAGYVLVPVMQTTMQGIGGSTLPTIQVQAQQDGAMTEGSQSYAARAITIGKGVQSLKNTPQSVTVVTRQRMDDQNMSTISDVLQNTPGVTAGEVGDGGRNFYSRGFKIGNIQYDGVPLSRSFYAVGTSYTGSAVYLDRVEVLRGAQGLLEGAGQPGGSVNLVRKRGQAERAVAVDFKAGSWTHYGVQLDAGGPLNAEGTLRGRMVVDYDSQDSFIDIVNSQDTNIYLALDYDLTASTTIGLGIASSRLRSTPFFGGIPSYSDGRSLNLPRSAFLGATWNRWDREETQAFFDVTHRFNNDWQLKVSATHVKEHSDTEVVDATGAVDPVTLTGTGRNAWLYDKNAKHVGLDVNLNGRFNALGMGHEVMVGAGFSRLTSEDSIKYNYTMPPLDVFNPDHNIPKPTDYPSSNRLSKYEPHTQKGIYGQLRTHLTDATTIILGSRISWFESVYKTVQWNSESKTEKKGQVTPYAGIVHALNPQWSVYASYADIFEAQTQTDVSGQTLSPVIGANYEAGIKGELMDGRLNTSFAVYRIDQTNRAVDDHAAGKVCNGGYCSRAAGKVRSQGFETEISGELSRGWQIAGGYTYNHNKYLIDSQNEGKKFSEETPRHLLRLWSTYRLQGDWQKVSVGGGVSYQSGLENSVSKITQGGYAIWNARIGYQINSTWSAALNIDNLFDKTYFEYPGYLENRSNYGTPRNMMLTLKGRF